MNVFLQVLSSTLIVQVDQKKKHISPLDTMTNRIHPNTNAHYIYIIFLNTADPNFVNLYIFSNYSFAVELSIYLK